MSGRRRMFRECDLRSALKVAQSLNAGTVRIDPRTGEITIDPHPRQDASPKSHQPRMRIRL